MGEPHDLGCLGVEDHDACTCVDVLRDRISTLERERDEYRDRLRAALSAQTYVAPIELRKQLDAAERERDEALNVMREYLAELDNPSPDVTMRLFWRGKMRALLEREEVDGE